MSRPISPLPLPANWQEQASVTPALFQSLKNFVFGVSLVLLLTVTAACGGGGGGSSAAPQGNTPTPPPSGTGEVIIGITDAEGEYVTYTVDVLSLTLNRANGDTVETLPLSTRIDFNELTEVTELLTIATVPEGNYESASIRMDFSDAEIFVQDVNGDAVQATPIDADGNVLNEVEMRLSLTGSDVIRIRAGAPAAFSLDFDLDASNTVDLTTAPPTVTVEPFLLATPELETDREHRVRGVLETFTTEENRIDLLVRPFRHRTGQFGEFALFVDDETQYEIDGVGYTGEEGLNAMALLSENAPVVGNGSIQAAGMQADIVLAGSSVPWSDADVVIGVVAARNADVLTVRGAHVEFSDGRSAFRGTFEVNLLDDTSVSAPGVDNANLSTQSISVGQRIVAWGEFLDDVSLDASRVRMKFNQLTAEVVEPAPLAVDLFFLNGRRPDAFNFAGTGVSPADDADPDFYEIDTGVLSLDAIEAGDLIRVRGLVNEFGSAPADYIARTVIDVQTDARAAFLKIGWEEGSSAPFNSIVAEAIDVDLTEARRALMVRGVPRAFIDEMENIFLLAPAEGQGVYAVQVRGAGEVHMYRQFSDMVDELVAQLDQGRLLHRISVQGAYNVSSNELTAKRAGFVFSANEDAQ